MTESKRVIEQQEDEEARARSLVSMPVNAEEEVIAAAPLEEGQASSLAAAQHVLCAIKDGRHELLTPQIIAELESGMDTKLEASAGLSWIFSGCRFLGAKAALAGGGAGLVANEANHNNASTTTLETAEERAFAQRYGFAYKNLLNSSRVYPLSFGFWDLKEDDSLFEFVLKSKATTFEMKLELLHVLIGACKSEHIGARQLENALERAAKAMGREQSHRVFAAPAQVLAEVKGFRRRTAVSLSWVQLEHARSTGEHSLKISHMRKAETLPLVDLMGAAGEMSLMLVDIQLPADKSFPDGLDARFSLYYLSAELTVARVASKLNSFCGAGQLTEALFLLFQLDNVAVKEMPLRFKLAIRGGSDIEVKECNSVQEAIEALKGLISTEQTLPQALMLPSVEPLTPGLDEAAKAMLARGRTVEQIAELLEVDLEAVKVTLAPPEQTYASTVYQVSALTEGPHEALQLYFTFGGYSQGFVGPVCATISTEKPLPELKHLEDEKWPVSSSMVQRMENVCGATNFSLILRNSEHMMRYIVAGTWQSVQTMEHSEFYKKVIAKEFVEGIMGKARKSSAQQHRLKSYNVLPKELNVAREASLRPVYCEKTCAACAAEEDGENSDGEMTVVKDPSEHTPTPSLFVQMHGKEPLSSLTPEMMENDINIVVTGPTGSGKSHLINVLFNCDVSESSSSMESVTQDIHFFRGLLNMSHPLVKELAAGKYDGLALFNDKCINIIDTIGFCDTHMTQEQVMATIKTKLKHNLVNVHKVIVVTDANNKLTLQATQAIQDIMSWLEYEWRKENWIFVSNKCDGLSKAEREKNLADTMKLLRVNQTDVEYLAWNNALVKLAIPVGFRPKDRHMSADAKKSMKSLGMAILCWHDNFCTPIPVHPQESLCTIS